ncbi:hypothetical protein DD238_004755 [Peronospora effusa]|uniref:Uncharacterized protein n=1 Tax=Peronospora effusa TaxID=542832 RepID=A0A3M6VHT7_9STRA|nr:hypothetical protein DD238_004757 [Peronospora effusa]RMX65723.1 hypothetical protein DD238_004755 [Peronospora effusa]
MIARQTARLTALYGAPQRAYTSLVNKKSHIPADQKLFMTSKAPTYIKRPSDRPLLIVMFLGLGLGFAQSLRGEISMATGTGKND